VIEQGRALDCGRKAAGVYDLTWPFTVSES
jgi:hypothetical protein